MRGFFCKHVPCCCNCGCSIVWISFMRNDAVNSVRIKMLLVEREFIVHVETDQQKTDHAKRKSQDIEARVEFAFPKISPPNYKITFDHTIVHYRLMNSSRLDNTGSEEKQNVPEQL